MAGIYIVTFFYTDSSAGIFVPAERLHLKLKSSECYGFQFKYDEEPINEQPESVVKGFTFLQFVGKRGVGDYFFSFILEMGFASDASFSSVFSICV